MAAEHDAPQPRVVLVEGGDLQAELEAGTPPREPCDLASEALLGVRFAIGRGRHGDDAVRVEVIDVLGVHEGVHGGVDRWRRPTGAEGAVLEEGDHDVLVLGAGVAIPEPPNSSRSRTARPGSVRLPRSPPEPLT